MSYRPRIGGKLREETSGVYRSQAASGCWGFGPRNGEVMRTRDNIQRSILPIPDRPHVGLTTCDAKDPDTVFPPIKDLRPPDGASSGCRATRATSKSSPPVEAA